MPLEEVGNSGKTSKFRRIRGEQMQALQNLNGETGAKAWSAMVFGKSRWVVLLQIPGVLNGAGEAPDSSFGLR
jgi:hypothetical protein